MVCLVVVVTVTTAVAGIVIVVQRPINIGDYISVEGATGYRVQVARDLPNGELYG